MKKNYLLEIGILISLIATNVFASISSPLEPDKVVAECAVLNSVNKEQKRIFEIRQSAQLSAPAYLGKDENKTTYSKIEYNGVKFDLFLIGNSDLSIVLDPTKGLVMARGENSISLLFGDIFIVCDRK